MKNMTEYDQDDYRYLGKLAPIRLGKSLWTPPFPVCAHSSADYGYPLGPTSDSLHE